MSDRKLYIRRFVLAVISLSLFITICVYHKPAQHSGVAHQTGIASTHA